MYKANNLCSLQEGQSAVVTSLGVGGSMRRRLQDIGLVSGTPVTCLHVSSAGDPAAYLIRGAVVAIRSDDSQLIKIKQ